MFYKHISSWHVDDMVEIGTNGKIALYWHIDVIVESGTSGKIANGTNRNMYIVLFIFRHNKVSVTIPYIITWT